MADLNRVRDPLEVAASSPDSRVRGLAIRKKEIDLKVEALQAEIAPIDAFISAYVNLPEPVEEVVEPPPKAVRTMSKANVKTPPREVFSEHIIALLRQHGPLSMDKIYPLYLARSGETKTREAVRVLLFKRKDVIGRVSDKDKRYWIVGEPLVTVA